VWVKVKVEKSGLSWKINLTLSFFSFVDDAVLFCLMGSHSSHIKYSAVIYNMQEVKKYPVQPRVSLVNRVTHTVFSMDLCVTDPPRYDLDPE